MNHGTTGLARRVVKVLAPLVIIVAVGLLPTRYDFRPWCDVSHDYVVAHANDLPKTLAEFRTYPLQLRRAVFSALGPRARFNLIQEHFDGLLADPRIGENTKAMLQRVRPFYTLTFITVKDQDALARVQHTRDTGDGYPPLTPALQRQMQIQEWMMSVMTRDERPILNIMNLSVVERPSARSFGGIRLEMGTRNLLARAIGDARLSASPPDCDCPVSTECRHGGCWFADERRERCSPYLYCIARYFGCDYMGVDICTAVCVTC
jgi:hypothetical protein